jgi:uncharacterized membrane protein YtjA (UPF0391 family)
VDLTGFIPPHLPALLWPPGDFCSPRARQFSWLCARKRRGTFASSSDYFRGRCANLIAPMSKRKAEVLIMLSWVVTFLIIALVAGILGFGGVAGASIEIAKIIFFVAILLFLVSAVVGLARGRTRV